MIVLHPKNKQDLDTLAKSYSSVLITGPRGSGVSSLIDYYYNQIPTASGRLDTLLRLETYDVASLRQLLSQLKLKNSNNSHRIIVIDDIEQLKIESQNILLKVLEEPPNDTSFIIGSHDPNAVLDTIKSRLHVIAVLKPPKEDLRMVFNIKPAVFEKRWSLADGWPGRITTESSSEDSFMDTTKDYLAGSNSIKAVILEKLDRASTQELLDNLSLIAKIAHAGSINSNNYDQASKWLAKRELYDYLSCQLDSGSSYKLIKPALLLEIKPPKV